VKGIIATLVAKQAAGGAEVGKTPTKAEKVPLNLIEVILAQGSTA